MLMLIIATTVLTLTYGVFLHNKPAREPDRERGEEHDNSVASVREHGLEMAFWTILLSSCAFCAGGQEVRSVLPPLGPAEPAARGFLQGVALGPTNWNVGFALGAGVGLKAMGSEEAHDLAMATLHVGRQLHPGESIPWAFLEHVEIGAELRSGAQYRPDAAYVVGLTPMLRYRFFDASRWTPFLDAGAGVTATDIHHPDLSTTFEFNLQAGIGLEWRWRQNTALVVQARYLHLSNAHIDVPNQGVNSLLFSGGLTWFF
jgi:opacity protein-like surface antigen